MTSVNRSGEQMRQTDLPGHDLLTRLAETLEALRQRTQSFVDLLTRERQAIMTLAMDQLTSVNEAKLQVLKELATYEDMRKDLIERLASIWRIPAEEMTIGGIAEHAGGPVATALKQQQAQLNHTILAARRSNQATGALLHKSLAFLQGAVGIMGAPFQVQLALYSESGSMQTSPPAGAMLERRG
jgi:flagellar biosynthesis/type III secretory pathway chaperone